MFWKMGFAVCLDECVGVRSQKAFEYMGESFQDYF